MKKLFYLLTIVAVGLFASCSNDLESTAGPTETSVVDNIECTMPNGVKMSVKSGNFQIVAAENQTIDFTPGEPMKSATVEQLADVFMDEFPAGHHGDELAKEHAQLAAFSSNFELVSDGLPVCIYPILVGGDAGNTFGYYYKDKEGNIIEEKLFELEKVTADPWYKIQSGGFKEITLPEGTQYGFYIYNNHQKSEPYWVDGENRFYTAAEKNAETQKHAVTYYYDKYQFIGFEDLPFGYSGCDKDYNDLIFMITPKQLVIDKDGTDQFSITIPVDRNLICDADDFLLRHDGEYVDIEKPIENNTVNEQKFHVKEKDMVVTVSELSKLEVGEEYTYETYLWVENLDGWTEDDITDLAIPSAYPEGYDIRYNVYKGIQGQGDTGYIKCSIHIIKLQ